MPETPDLQRHDVHAADGTRLRVYEVASEDADEAVLALHGAFTPARALFAPPVDGGTDHSWLHAIADRGRAAFALDVRGYGESEMLPAYDEPADANDAPAPAAVAATDVKAAYDFVAEQYDTHLLGVSWGTMVGAAFLEQYDATPESYTACAPVYDPPIDFEAVAATLEKDPDIGAWVTEEYDTVRRRQGGGDVFETVWAVTMETEQGLPDENAFKVQTGALADTRDMCEGNPPYDPAAIDVPTLIVRGSEDASSIRQDALTLYDALAVPENRCEYTELRGGTHFAMHGPRRHDLYSVTSDFQDRN